MYDKAMKKFNETIEKITSAFKLDKQHFLPSINSFVS